MLKIMTKMYVQNMPVAMFLAAQLVLVSFIFNISFVLTSADVQMLRNIKVSEKSLYYATRKESLDVDIEKLQNILGKERVGYIERNGKKCVDGMDSLDSPGLVYLGGVAQKISYKLSRGRWFSNAAHEVILGGEIAKKYKVGDELVISEENIEEKGIVVGILKEPAKEPSFASTDIDNLDGLFWDRRSVMLTNDKKLVQSISDNGILQRKSCLIDLADASKKVVEEIKKEYEICSVQDVLKHAKEQQKRRTVKETLRLFCMIAIAFVSVAIHIFLYVCKYKKELKVFRMLGMSWKRIYGMTLFGHICNVGIGALGTYIIFQNKGLLARFNLEPYAGFMRLGWYVTIIFFMVYLLNTAIVFGCVIRNEEQKQGEVL